MWENEQRKYEKNCFSPSIMSEKFNSTPLLVQHSPFLISETTCSKPHCSGEYFNKSDYSFNSMSKTFENLQFYDNIEEKPKKQLKKAKTGTVVGNESLDIIYEQKALEDSNNSENKTFNEKETLNKEFRILFDIKDENSNMGKTEINTEVEETEFSLQNHHDEEDFHLFNNIFPTDKQVFILPPRITNNEKNTIKVDPLKIDEIDFDIYIKSIFFIYFYLK